MLTVDDFDKAEEPQSGVGKRVIKMTLKEPAAGLGSVEIKVFLTSFRRGDSKIWAWEWSSKRGGYHSSLGKDHNPPIEEHHNVQSAASAAIKDVNYWSDEERLPREEKVRQDREREEAMLDKQINRFLES